jgi:hypothetical protein
VRAAGCPPRIGGVGQREPFAPQTVTRVAGGVVTLLPLQAGWWYHK